MKFTWSSEICWPSSESITIREGLLLPCSPFKHFISDKATKTPFSMFLIVCLKSQTKCGIPASYKFWWQTEKQGGSSWEGFTMLQKPWTIVFKEEEIKRVHQYHVGKRRNKRWVYHVGKSSRRLVSVWKEPVARKSLFKLDFFNIRNKATTK